MAKTASIESLARKFAKGKINNTTLRRAVTAARLREIPLPLWDKIETERSRSPRFAHALARVAFEIARRKRNPALRARAELALIQTLNTLGEFPDALKLCEPTAARFEKIGEAENTARVWLEAATAETWRGDLEMARSYLARAESLDQSRDLRLRTSWIAARILNQQSEFVQAAAQFEKLHAQWDPRDELNRARLWCEMGAAQERLDPHAALPLLQQARTHLENLNCAVELAWCNLYLAEALMDVNRFEQADILLQNIKSFCTRQDLGFLHARCNLELGFLYWYQNQFQRALEVTEQARASFSKLGVAQEVSTCDINISVYLRDLNRNPEAIPHLESAAQMALYTKRYSKAGVAHNNLGEVYDALGDYARALQQHNTARELFAAQNMVTRLIECDLALGRTHLHLGQLARTAQVWQRARRLARRNHLPSLLAQAELFLAQLALSQGRFKQARTRLPHAGAQFQGLGQSVFVAYCERLLAQAHKHTPAAALAHLQMSRKLLARQNLFVEMALCDLTRGDLHCAWSEWDRAERAYRRARNILEPAFPDHAWRVAYGLGKIARARGDGTRALREWQRGAELIARLRGAIALEAWSNDLFQTRQRIVSDALQLAHQLQRAKDATRVIETAKAQTFLRHLDGHAPRAESPELSALEECANALRRTLIQQRKRLVLDTKQISQTPRIDAPPTLAALNETLRAYERVAEQVRLTRHGLKGITTLTPFALETFRAYANARWGDAWTALDYFFANGKLYVARIEPNESEVRATRWTMQDQARLIRATSTHPQQRELVYHGTLHGHRVVTPSDALAYLAARLIPADVRARREERTLIISPHELLHQLPFHALEEHGKPLLERFTFVYTPSLQALVELTRKRDGARDSLRAFVWGADTFADAAPLRHTRAEVKALKRMLDATTLWQNKATRAAILNKNEHDALMDFDVLHFSTHARLAPNAPHSSRILLADGALDVLDILGLKLDARLVTLSACESALGKGGGKGDDWLGLARAFFYAGARAVVASLWQVDDKSTARLMKVFYQHLKNGEPIAQALRAAQLDLQRRGYSAYHWVPFVALGQV